MTWKKGQEAVAQNSVQKMAVGHQPRSVSPSKEGEEGQRQVIWANSVRLQFLSGTWSGGCWSHDLQLGNMNAGPQLAFSFLLS